METGNKRKRSNITFFFIIAILMAIVVIYVLFKIPDEKKYLLMKICLRTMLRYISIAEIKLL